MSPSDRTLESSVVVPPGTCQSGTIRDGQYLRIVDVEGGQVGDFVAIKLDDPTEYLDCTYTNWANLGWRWKPGATIFTNHMKRMWVIREDRTRIHFTGGGFCSNDARRLFFDPKDETKGCRDCLEETFAENGIPPHHLQSTSCFNVFMNVEYSPDGSWLTRPPVTKAGDYIELKAKMDIFWALSTCIFAPVNSGKPSPLRVEILSKPDTSP